MCACSRVGEECGRAVVGEGAFQICDVWLSLCVCGFGEGCGGTLVGNVESFPLACGLFLWESWLVPTFAVWVSCGLGVQCLNTVCWGFLLLFLLEFSFQFVRPIFNRSYFVFNNLF